MNKIPKTMHFYWGGTVLSYLRYMSVATFRKFNPDWKIILHTPVQVITTQSWTTFENKQVVTSQNYYERLKDLDVTVQMMDMAAIGFSNALPEVIKADITRLHLLSTCGGAWSDNDVLYFRPLSHAFRPTEHIAFFCFQRPSGPKFHSIGLLAGAPGNKYFEQLFKGASKVLDPSQYQSAGSPYYRTQLNESNIDKYPDLFNMDIGVINQQNAVSFNLWERPTREYMDQICPGRIGFHWYAGHPMSGKMQNLVTEGTYQQFDNIICWTLDKVNRNINV